MIVSTGSTESKNGIGNVLIVDDDRDFADSLEEYLEKFGYRIRTEYSLESAKQAVVEFSPQVVLVDVRLGPSKGIDLISMIKKDWPDLLFIVMTAHADTDTAIEALQRGAYDYLRKPLNLEILTSTLTRCFRNLKLEQEKEEALNLLKINEERFRGLIEKSVLGIMIHDDMTPLFLNQSFASIFGYASRDDLANLTSLEGLIAHPQSEPFPWKETLSPAKLPTAGPLEMTGRRKDGQEIQIEVISQEIQWEGNTVTQTSLVDITHRKQLEAQLRQIQKMEAVGQLAGGVAHDINNMLQIIQGYTELAMGSGQSQVETKSYLEKVLAAAENSSQLTRQLLAFSRREGLKPKGLDINPLIQNLMGMLHNLLGEDIALTTSGAEDLPTVLADQGMIQQVLVNLCINARDAMPLGGDLTIETKLLVPDPSFRKNHVWADQAKYVSISVSDSGEGIEKEFISRIFDPFFTTKDAAKGTGLGLSMAYGIIQQHKGAIEVESEPGTGTTFTIYLPTTEIAPQQEEEHRAEARVSGGKETILYAEDQEDVLALMQGLLEDKGYRVVTALNGEDALRLFLDDPQKFDLAILDVIMPKMSGRSVFDKIRAKNPSLPVIFSTGYASEQLDEDFIQNNEFQLLRKPFSPGELYQTVRKALEGA